MTTLLLLFVLSSFANIDEVGSCPPEQISHAKKAYAPLPYIRHFSEECEHIGTPTLQLQIDEKGRISGVKFLKSSGCEPADDRLRACMKYWRYEPAACSGEPVVETIFLTIHWHLEERERATRCGPETERDEKGAITPAPKGSEVMLSWEELLDLGLEHSSAAKAKLQSVSKSSPLAEHRDLARILLAEWSLDSSVEILQQPRLVYKPKLSLKVLDEQLPEKIELQNINVHIIVDPRGRIESYEIICESQFEAVNEQIRRAMENIRYRPARKQNRYVSAESSLQFSLHIQ